MSEPGAPFSPGSVARQLDYCTFCPKMCRHACPVSTASGRETYIPQVKMDRLKGAKYGPVGWDLVAPTNPTRTYARRPRPEAGSTAPPWGLYLERFEYGRSADQEGRG